MAGAGGVPHPGAPAGAASAFAFVAIVAAAFRADLRLVGRYSCWRRSRSPSRYLLDDAGPLRVLAYALGFLAPRSWPRPPARRGERADQAELLLAQTQRSQEEQLRAARMEESTLIAREIHDVLAHALAGLTIQLEATATSARAGGRPRRDPRPGPPRSCARPRRAAGSPTGGRRPTWRYQVAVPDAVRALVEEYRSRRDHTDDSGRRCTG